MEAADEPAADEPAPSFVRLLRPSQADVVLRRIKAEGKLRYAAAAAADERAERLRVEERTWAAEARAREERAAAREAEAASTPPPSVAAPQLPAFAGSGAAGNGPAARAARASHREATGEAREARERAEAAAKVAVEREAKAAAAATAAEVALAAVWAQEEAGITASAMSPTQAWLLKKKAPRDAEAAAKVAEAARAEAAVRSAEATTLELGLMESHYNPNVVLLHRSAPVQKLHALDAFVDREHTTLHEHRKLIGNLDDIGKGRETAAQAARFTRARRPLPQATIDSQSALAALSSYGAHLQPAAAAAAVPSSPLKRRWPHVGGPDAPNKSPRSPRYTSAHAGRTRAPRRWAQ